MLLLWISELGGVNYLLLSEAAWKKICLLCWVQEAEASAGAGADPCVGDNDVDVDDDDDACGA